MSNVIPRMWTVAVELFGPAGSFVVRAAIDTGATGTLLPPEALMAIGCDPTLSDERTGIITASGREFLSLVQVPEIHALGHRAKNMSVMVHALPSSSSINGLLGMDFLIQLPAIQALEKQFKPYFV